MLFSHRCGGGNIAAKAKKIFDRSVEKLRTNFRPVPVGDLILKEDSTELGQALKEEFLKVCHAALISFLQQ